MKKSYETYVWAYMGYIVMSFLYMLLIYAYKPEVTFWMYHAVTAILVTIGLEYSKRYAQSDDSGLLRNLAVDFVVFVILMVLALLVKQMQLDEIFFNLLITIIVSLALVSKISFFL